jgi:autotransporter-associated beta strand protein
LASSNVGGLTKLGPGLLTLNAANGYSGLTTVNAGTLQLGDGVANNGSVNGAINNNSALVFANPTSQVYGGAISGSGSVTKTGPGTLVVAFNQTYSGPTAINAGVVQLGTGATDRFQNNGAFFTVNSSGIASTPFTNNVLTLTDGNNGEARSAYYNAPLNVASPFTAQFVYQMVAGGTADGVAFMLQNDSRGLTALGNGGGGLGYQGITPSAALQLNIYAGATQGGIGSAVVSGGTIGPFASTGAVNLASGDPIEVTLSYDGSNMLVETLTDLTNSNTFSTSYTVGSLATIVSGSTAYAGFSGATGGLNSIQSISNFTFTAPGSTNILPAATALSISGGTLDLFGAKQTVASLSGSGSVTNSGTSTSTLAVSGSTSSTFSGTIGDGLSQVALAVSGSATLYLSGTNTYTGGTTVSGDGTLILTNSKAVADGTSLAVGDPSLLALLPAAVVPSPAASVPVAPVPEPGTLVLVAAGAVAAGWSIWPWRKRKKV